MLTPTLDRVRVQRLGACPPSAGFRGMIENDRAGFQYLAFGILHAEDCGGRYGSQT